MCVSVGHTLLSDYSVCNSCYFPNSIGHSETSSGIVEDIRNSIGHSETSLDIVGDIRNYKQCQSSERNYILSGVSKMSLAIIYRSNDVFYYAADSRCVLVTTKDDGTVNASVNDYYKKIFLLNNKIVTVTGNAIVNNLHAGDIITQSSSCLECVNRLKMFDVALLTTDKTDSTDYCCFNLKNNCNADFKNHSLHCSGHSNATAMIEKLGSRALDDDDLIIDYINKIFAIFIDFPELVEGTIGGPVNIFKQEYGKPPVKLQGWYDL